MVVDDEAPARSELVFLLEETGKVAVVGEASGGDEALRVARRCRPDVVFLDVQMPDLSGCAVAERLASLRPAPLVVFATAYDQYAVSAFDLQAVDYILKPYNPDRLADTVTRVAARLRQARGETLPAGTAAPEHPLRAGRVAKLPAWRGDKMVLVAHADILYLQSTNRALHLRTAAEDLRVSFSLAEAAGRLGPGFLRVHKSFVVNLDHVLEVVPWFKGTYKLILRPGPAGVRAEVPVGRAYARSLRAALGI